MKNSFQKTVLTVADVARIANCHRSTVLRYEDKGVLLAKRDTVERPSLDTESSFGSVFRGVWCVIAGI
jgi:hypothetical protein